MSESYAREILRRNVAQMCQTIGWNGINSSPLDILLHLLERHIRALGIQTNRYAELFNRTEPNLHDLALVFRDLHIQLPELAEYTQSVPPVPPPIKTERFPKPKESNLNFLKPGSHEVVTRPMHVHEHLPPMFPEKERETPLVAGTVEIRQNGIDSSENTTCVSPEISVTDSPEKPKDIFKRPIDPVSQPNNKRPRLRIDEEERTREISSVMMTMSGFLSPAREGKLPEAKAPTIISEKHDRHKVSKVNSNLHSKVPVVEKSDKKSKKSKLLNGKIMKSKRKDKTHKESNKSKDSNKLDRFPPGYPIKNKDVHPTHHNHVTMPAPRQLPTHPKSIMPPPPVPSTLQIIPEIVQPVVKQEPIDPPTPVPKTSVPKEDTIPVPRKIPISKSPLVSNPLNSRSVIATNSMVPDIEIKKEVIDEEEKLASQPDRSKINIFKRITNKSKEDKNNLEVVHEKSQSDSMISKLHNSTHDLHENKKLKREVSVINNNNSPVDLSKEIDIRAHEVISIDDDSMDKPPVSKCIPPAPLRPDLTMNKSFPLLNSRDAMPTVSQKIKKEKRTKDKKDKAAKLEAKLKRQQQQIAFEMVQMTEKKKMKLKNDKPPKLGRPKNESKMPQMPSGFPFFPGMPPGRLLPGPGLIPNPGLIPSNDFLAGLANNPALRGLPSPNLLTNPFALPGGPGMIPGPSFLPGSLGSGIPNHLMPMSNFPHTSRSSLVKIPPMLRRPSLEVIPVENENERSFHKTSMMGREKDRHDKHKSSTIPNILQKQKSKSNKDHKSSNIYKMPPVQPDITIELNPPKIEPPRQELPKDPHPQPIRLSTPQPPEPPCPAPHPEIEPRPKLESILTPTPIKLDNSEVPHDRENTEKRKEKSHKKEKRDKDGIKIKKKKDKKDKNKEKVEKRKDKDEKQADKEMKDKIKKDKKEKKKEKLVADGLVPKLTLKLGSSNSNSPMPPSSPDILKLNIKPVMKKEDNCSSPLKDETASREQSRSPELAQISALVTRPPKQKHLKHNHIGDVEGQSTSPTLVSDSPPRKNHPPSSISKFKRISMKSLAKKGNLDSVDDVSISEQTPDSVPVTTEKPSGPLPTPYYVDEHGNKIWVCPACGRPDNGSPMIGCDGCDGWYHWVCVGITEEPGATEDWFCKSCLAKRAAMVLAGVTSGKKRGRKPKGEKVREEH